MAVTDLFRFPRGLYKRYRGIIGMLWKTAFWTGKTSWRRSLLLLSRSNRQKGSPHTRNFKAGSGTWSINQHKIPDFFMEPVIYSDKFIVVWGMIAWFSVTDIMWVPSLRDGMNITCKEFVAVRKIRAESWSVWICRSFYRNCTSQSWQSLFTG